MTNIIGIRAEGKNPWERRSPLIPSYVGELVRANTLDILEMRMLEKLRYQLEP